MGYFSDLDIIRKEGSKSWLAGDPELEIAKPTLPKKNWYPQPMKSDAILSCGHIPETDGIAYWSYKIVGKPYGGTFCKACMEAHPMK